MARSLCAECLAPRLSEQLANALRDVFWGFLHGIYIVIQRLCGKPFGRLIDSLKLPKFGKMAINIFLVYTATCFAWIFFRATDFSTALEVIIGIGKFENFTFGSIVNKFWALKGFLLIGMLLLVEITDFKFNYGQLVQKSPTFRVISFVVILWIIAFFGSFGANAFIYFQF